MSHGIYASLGAGARSFEALDLVSNNLSNADTTGFRAQRAVFRVVPAGDRPGTAAQGRIAERYLMLEEVGTDMRPGALVDTGDPGHLALDGEGFFLLGGEEGPRLTRDGTTRVGVDGTLVHQSGAPLLSTEGQPIRVRPGPYHVGRDGVVVQGEVTLGRLAVVTVERPEALERLGANLFDAGDRELTAAGETAVVQGALESSNVDPVAQLVELIRISRFHEAYVKTLDALDQSRGQLNNKVGTAR